MEEQLYAVYDGEVLLANNMNNKNALMFMAAYCDEYYMEPALTIKLVRMPRVEVSVNE